MAKRKYPARRKKTSAVKTPSSRSALMNKALSIQARRSAHAQARDSIANAKRILPVTEQNIYIWSKNPRRIDLQGVDSVGKGRLYKTKSKQKKNGVKKKVGVRAGKKVVRKRRRRRIKK